MEVASSVAVFVSCYFALTVAAVKQTGPRKAKVFGNGCTSCLQPRIMVL